MLQAGSLTLTPFIDVLYAAVIALGLAEFPRDIAHHCLAISLLLATVFITAHDWYHYHDNLEFVQENVWHFALQVFIIIVLQRLFAYAAPASVASWLVAVVVFLFANIVWNLSLGFKLHGYRAIVLAIMALVLLAAYWHPWGHVPRGDLALPVLGAGFLSTIVIWRVFHLVERHQLDVANVTVKQIGSNHADEIAVLQRRIYPTRMQEKSADLAPLLDSSDLSRGVCKGHRLIGYGIAQKREEQRNVIYLYDIGIATEYQRRGLGKRLAAEILRATHSRGLNVELHCRRTSYPIFGSPDTMECMGYKIACDQFMPDFYLREFGVAEDAHYLLLTPIASPVGAACGALL